VILVKHVVPFSDIRMKDVPLVGGKTASLGEMISVGLPVPDGFSVTAEAYKHFIAENKLDHKIREIIKNTDIKKLAQLNKAGAEIRKLITDAPMPEEIEWKIMDAYAKLGSRFVAVRSSATAEDLPDASFAGEQESYLNVDKRDLIKKIKECFASLWTDRAISYREDKHFNHFKVYLSVAVQHQIFSKSSGVMFTLDPDSGHRNFIVINSGFGLGDYIVQGKITPDEFWIFKKNGKLIDKKLGIKKMMEIRDIFGVKKKTLSKTMQETFSISDREAEHLGSLGLQIEAHYKRPMDIEWAKGSDNKIYIIQARPETIHSAKKTVYEEYRMTQKGTVIAEGASVGRKIASGIVNIIPSVKQMSKFKQGQILVTVNTDPDWEPIMKLASAIITEQGGRTCFAGNTKVLTNRGFMPMQEVHNLTTEGERFAIFSYHPKTGKACWKRVKAATKNRLDTIKVSISQTGKIKENSIIMTPDHKVYTYESREIVKKPIKSILSEDMSVALVDKLPSSTERIDNSKLAYLLGAIATDGHIEIRYGKTKPRRGSVTFTQKPTEGKKEFIETVNSCFMDTFGKAMIPREKFSSSILRGRLIQGYATDYRCYSLDIAMQMSTLMGELPRLSLGFTEEAALNFLAGAIDGDGCMFNNRINIYVSKENLFQAIILSCLKLGIVPQVTKNRTIYNVQILERLEDILLRTKRVKGVVREKELGTKLFSARQILSDIIDEVNYKGRIRPYVDSNLLIDARKLEKFVLPMMKERGEMEKIIQSDTRMQRVSFIENTGEMDVYNLEVDAENDLDHCYVVFTERYTPLLVSNSHAAIVSRELGIPALVGIDGITRKLKNGEAITVDCSGEKGRIWKGKLTFEKKEHDIAKMPKTKTKIYVNVGEPSEAVDASLLPVDGAGLVREEFIISDAIQEHPLAMIKQKREHIFVRELASGIGKIAASFYPRPITVRFSDFKTNEYKGLKGGEPYEPHEENPMIGWRGASRYFTDYEPGFRLELKAFKICIEDWGLDNIKLMVPFCRTIAEAEAVLKIIESEKVHAEVGAMAEIPSNVIIADQFSKLYKFFSIGSNDLTQLTLGIDRDSSKLAKEFDERNDAVKRLIHHLIVTAHKFKRPVGICGQAPSDYPDFAEWLVREGIDSISVNPDVAVKTRLHVAEVEKKKHKGKPMKADVFAKG
jgi:pyruvate,water dikinase